MIMFDYKNLLWTSIDDFKLKITFETSFYFP